jgi:hypothetical protein
MTMHYCRGGIWRRPSALLVRTALLAVFFFTPIISQTFDVILVQNPGYLRAYDEFQQSLASSQLAMIQSFVPMKVLNARDVLSDGITHCMKVDIDGDIFFLLNDNSGKLAGWNKLGAVRIYKRKFILLDTIKVLVSHKIIFESFPDGSQSYLTTGERCVRYFEDGGSVYIKCIGKYPVFGWIRISGTEEGSLWKKVHTEEVRSEFSPALHERVYERVQQVNRTLAQVYSVLNRESGKRLTAPQWYADSESESTSFILIPDSAVRLYPKSVELLKTSLQTYLLGTSYNVLVTGNKIEINPR